MITLLFLEAQPFIPCSKTQRQITFWVLQLEFYNFGYLKEFDTPT